MLARTIPTSPARRGDKTANALTDTRTHARAHTHTRTHTQLAKGDNVVLLSNHQSESDTHCLFTLFEDQLGPEFGKIASDTVFMAGERVLRDAIVVREREREGRGRGGGRERER